MRDDALLSRGAARAVTFDVLLHYLSIVKLRKTMQTYKYFIGADIGKETLAICVIDTAEKRLLECAITNTKAGIQTLLTKLEKLPDFSLKTTLICMEHTGGTASRWSAFSIPWA